MAQAHIDINRLTRDERLELIEQLWDSLAAMPGELALTDGQRDELDCRLYEMDRDDNLGIPWEEVVRQIRERAISQRTEG